MKTKREPVNYRFVVFRGSFRAEFKGTAHAPWSRLLWALGHLVLKLPGVHGGKE